MIRRKVADGVLSVFNGCRIVDLIKLKGKKLFLYLITLSDIIFSLNDF